MDIFWHCGCYRHLNISVTLFRIPNKAKAKVVASTTFDYIAYLSTILFSIHIACFTSFPNLIKPSINGKRAARKNKRSPCLAIALDKVQTCGVNHSGGYTLPYRKVKGANSMSDDFYVLGSGAKAVVYLGMNAKTGGFVAVKELNLPSADDAAEASSILGEVQRLRSLDHPNVIKCFGAKPADGGSKVHIILEYCAGGSVARNLRHFGPLSEAVCQRYIRDALSGLEYLHRIGICHRDVKPENLLLTAEGICKLGDLGSSKFLPSEGSGLVTCVGTPQYMAPEVIAGGTNLGRDADTANNNNTSTNEERSGYGTSADIWSLGCCLYEMISGEPFVTGSNPIAIMYAVSEADVGGADRLALLDHAVASEGLRSFITSCLQYEPAKRPTAEELLLHPWLSQENADEGAVIYAEDIVVPTDHYLNRERKLDTAWGREESKNQEVGSRSPPKDDIVGSAESEGSSKQGTGRAAAASQRSAFYQTYSSSADFEPISDDAHSKTVGSLPSVTEDTCAAEGEAEDVRPETALIATCQYCRLCPALFECDECRNVFGNMYRLCPVCWSKAHARLAASSAHKHRKRPVLTSAPYEAPQRIGVPVRVGRQNGNSGYEVASAHAGTSKDEAPIEEFTTTGRPRSADDPLFSTVATMAARGRGSTAATNRVASADGRGVLLSNGAFVDLSLYEEAGWTCGCCSRFNQRGEQRCQACGQLN